MDVHFARYSADSPEDRQIFQNVLLTFQQQAPFAEEPDLLSIWEFLYERSVGCVGILKDWLVRAAIASLKNGEATLSLKELERTALSVSQCEKILIESREGEVRLNDNEDSRSHLRTLLGISGLKEVAAALGLRGIRRFYTEKGLSDLAHAIAAKNAVLKRRGHNFEDPGSAEPVNRPAVSPCAKVRHSAGVPRAIVQRGLEDALAKDSYIRLKAVAVFVGLRSTRRFYMEKGLSDLAHAIAAKNAELKKRGRNVEDHGFVELLNPPNVRHSPGVPRAVVQRGLEDALAKDSYTSVSSVAASPGLRSTTRFYKEKRLSDLAHAISAKNADLKKRHYEEIKLSLKTAQTEYPARSIREIARRVGHKARVITGRLSKAEPAPPSGSLVP